jgi:hypothetical protein
MAIDSGLIAATAAITGLVTAVAALLTVLEMRRQRVSLLRPELVVEDTEFHALGKPASNDAIVVKLSHEEATRTSDSLPERTFSFEVRNIGRGIAREVTYKWSFEAPAFGIMVPSERRPDGHHQLRIQDSTFTFEGDGASWRGVGDEGQRLGMVYPEPAVNPRRIALYWPVEMLMKHYCERQWLRSSPDDPIRWPDSELRLDLSYRDSAGRPYSKSLTLRPRFGMISISGRGTPSGQVHTVARGQFLASEFAS